MIELYAVCGLWKLNNNIHWEFEMDNERGASLINIDENTRFSELVKILLEDFDIDIQAQCLKLSYSLPAKSSTIGSIPIFIRNDRQLEAFKLKYAQSGGVLHLCVTVEDFCEIVEQGQPRSTPFIESVTAVTQDQTSSNLLVGNVIDVYTHTRDQPIPNSYVEGVPRNMTTSVGYPSCSSHSTGLIDVDSLFCGKLFKDKTEMRSQMRMYAVKHSFEFHTFKSDNKRYVLKCIDEKCSWRLLATKAKASDSFVVRKYSSQHSCDSALRNVNHRQATARTLAGLVSNHFAGGKLPLRPKQLMEIFRNDHGVGVSYSKAWRAQEHASELARGIPADSYEVLPSWFHMIEKKNPGTITYIKADSDNKFRYGFLAFGASIRGFKLMRKVISIDGAHLKSKYKGTLLAASAQDGNFQLYPIAFAVVDSENDASWDWFLRCLKTIIPDEEDLVFVSDRASSIATALSVNYVHAHHGICTFHLQKNLETRFRASASLLPVVHDASRAYTQYDFDYLFTQISNGDPDLGEYLWQADIRKWSRAYSPSNRYNIMTSNCAESINSRLKETREYPIVCLFDTIRSILTRWFNERREESCRHPYAVTTKVGNKMNESYNNTTRWLEVSQVNENIFEVKAALKTYMVNLDTRKCTCCMFDIDKFPCAHGIAAAKHVNLNENMFVDDYHSTERWRLAYSESIHPVGDMEYWEIPESVSTSIRPPSTRIPSGRRKKKRIASSWEYGKAKTNSKQYKCSRCGQCGHNKSSCVAAI
ncbi:PREDICTED: uncharacterized protein LOC109131269 [Camelina sativa]|uniref:Uncharacterized protein LOC109131269 n=1 Tax=Camelina sativa TaxID=90675 RepID=A0ABM1RES9_CAMSA|nr:PREDICTED: uncharacterized protein LOC109131269 [Camelina sativa]